MGAVHQTQPAMCLKAFLFLATCVLLSEALFFKAPRQPRSECHSNRQCGGDKRFCVPTYDVWCRFKNSLAGSKVNCNYRTCVECIRDSDCGGEPNYCNSGIGYGSCRNRIEDERRAERRRKYNSCCSSMPGYLCAGNCG